MKKASFAILFVLMLVPLVGCGDDDDNDGLRADNDTVCRDGETCRNSCVDNGAACDVQCNSGSNCSATCHEGQDCDFQCNEGAVCNFDCGAEECQVGSSSQECSCSGQCVGICGGVAGNNGGNNGANNGGNNGGNNGANNGGACVAACGSPADPGYAACVAACAE